MQLLPLELNSDFKYALDALEKTDRSLFITGRAGTGKSTLLQLFRKATRKKAVVLAPTGIAALNVRGQTIHSFFGFPPRFLQAKDIFKSRHHKLYKNISVLVIDEISMVRADMLDAIDRFLRINRENPMPFGGVQMVFIGDLFQLPPVIASDEEKRLFQYVYQSPYFFSSHVLRDFPLEMMELKKVYRQENRHFLRLLDAVRVNQLDWEDLEDLNARYQPGFEAQGFFITLSPRNAKVDAINHRELMNLATREFIYDAVVTGIFDQKAYPAEPQLRLRTGAQVMFVKNDPESKYVNGTLGKVVELDVDVVKVMIEEDNSIREIDVIPQTWEMLRYMQSLTDPTNIEAEVVGTFKQYPLRLAWAVTIHKSQGKTFDKVVIDMDKGAFEFGQTYVALSRCRTLEGIILKQKLTPRDILVDERVVEFFEQGFRR